MTDPGLDFTGLHHHPSPAGFPGSPSSADRARSPSPAGQQLATKRQREDEQVNLQRKHHSHPYSSANSYQDNLQAPGSPSLFQDFGGSPPSQHGGMQYRPVNPSQGGYSGLASPPLVPTSMVTSPAFSSVSRRSPSSSLAKPFPSSLDRFALVPVASAASSQFPFDDGTLG